jgi:hypothetical protein
MTRTLEPDQDAFDPSLEALEAYEAQGVNVRVQLPPRTQRMLDSFGELGRQLEGQHVQDAMEVYRRLPEYRRHQVRHMTPLTFLAAHNGHRLRARTQAVRPSRRDSRTRPHTSRRARRTDASRDGPGDTDPGDGDPEHHLEAFANERRRRVWGDAAM